MSLTLADVLEPERALDPTELKAFGGFGGLHGGLAAALLTRRMRDHVPTDSRLTAVSARFLKPIAGPLAVDASALSVGGTTSVAHASGSSDAGVPLVTADAVFSRPGRAPTQPRLSPPMPTDIVPAREAEVFRVPPEFVPISTRMEIRPATPGLPYTGGAEPVLCAWIRLTDPVPRTSERLLVLIDALAPSYAAVLSDLTPIPTVGLTVHLTDVDALGADEWVLVRAETTNVGADGWLTETIDVWNETGTHVATATQLRVVRPAPPGPRG